MFGRKTKKQLQNAEERAGHHFVKLWKIDQMIRQYRKDNGLNPHYLIDAIEKELDRPLHQI